MALLKPLRSFCGLRVRLAGVVLGGLILTGCAQLPPLVEQLKTNQKTRITLLVEEGPFQYTTPASIDAGGGGLLILALVTAVAALAAQSALDGANTRLATAISEKAVAADHRKAFVSHLVRRLDQLGITVDVVPVPYEATSLGKDRRLYRPVPDKLPPPGDAPMFILLFDAGTCSFGSVAPCMRYMFHAFSPPVKAGAPLLMGGTDLFRTASSTTPPPPPPSAVRYRGVFGTSPDRSKPDAAEFKTFASVDEAVLKVVEFDRELSKIVPVAADELVSWLESTPTRAAAGAAANPPPAR